VALIAFLVVLAVYHFLENFLYRRRRKRAEANWRAFASARGFSVRNAKPRWAYSGTLPMVEGTHRLRSFELCWESDDECWPTSLAWLSVKCSGPAGQFVQVVRPSLGEPRYLASALRHLPKGKDLYIEDSFGPHHLHVAASSREIAEMTVGNSGLADRIGSVVQDFATSVLMNEKHAGCGADWLMAEPGRVLQALDLLCDLADAAERAATGSVERLPTGGDG